VHKASRHFKSTHAHESGRQAIGLQHLYWPGPGSLLASRHNKSVFEGIEPAPILPPCHQIVTRQTCI
jgi:hypothetical protein